MRTDKYLFKYYSNHFLNGKTVSPHNEERLRSFDSSKTSFHGTSSFSIDSVLSNDMGDVFTLPQRTSSCDSQGSFEVIFGGHSRSLFTPSPENTILQGLETNLLNLINRDGSQSEYLTLGSFDRRPISPTPLSKEEKQPATWTREYSRDWHTSEEDSAQGKG